MGSIGDNNYEGEFLMCCPKSAFQFDRAYAVVVSGMLGNNWGHMLLNTGGIGGIYFQVAGRKVCPRYMNEGGYRRYLHEHAKRELRRYALHLKDPNAAQSKLEELMSKPWGWWGVVHNCETFVEDIIVAGGGRPIHQGTFYNPSQSRQQTPGASGGW